MTRSCGWTCEDDKTCHTPPSTKERRSWGTEGLRREKEGANRSWSRLLGLRSKMGRHGKRLYFLRGTGIRGTSVVVRNPSATPSNSYQFHNAVS